jgi:uncharacterized protein (DUF2132 family)
MGSVTAALRCRPFRARVARVTQAKSNDPLHGVTLENLLKEIVAHYGWRELARRVEIRCFLFDPSIKSSLTFLRKNPWARTKVEEIFVEMKAAR